MQIVAVDFQDGLNRAWTSVITVVPKVIAAIVIVVVGVLVARLVAGLLDKVLDRVGFDRAVERGGIRQALARSKYEPSDILAKIVFWALVLTSLQIAFNLFGPNPVSDLLRGAIAYLPNVFVAVVIVVIVALLARAVRDLLASLLSAMQGGQVIANAAGIAILAFGVFAALDQLKIAPRIVTGLWYALLATVVLTTVVAVGGGGIRTMQRYWERAAGRVEAEAPRTRERARMQGTGEYARSVDVAGQPSGSAPSTEQLRTRTTRGTRRPEG
jgi:Conserved TM helix